MIRKKLQYKGNSFKPKEKIKDPKEFFLQDLSESFFDDDKQYNYTCRNHFDRLDSYSDIEKVREKFKSLQSVNDKAVDKEIYKGSSAILIRSLSFDDIHKAMKYGYWSSSNKNNKMISELYKKNLNRGNKTLLVFRVIDSRNLIGIAEVISEYISDQNVNLWLEYSTWKGIFYIKWIWVKGIDMGAVKNRNNGKRTFELVDGSLLSDEATKEIIEAYTSTEYQLEKSILKMFHVLDIREDMLRSYRKIIEFDMMTDSIYLLNKRDKKGIQSGEIDSISETIEEIKVSENKIDFKMIT